MVYITSHAIIGVYPQVKNQIQQESRGSQQLLPNLAADRHEHLCQIRSRKGAMATLFAMALIEKELEEKEEQYNELMNIHKALVSKTASMTDKLPVHIIWLQKLWRLKNVAKKMQELQRDIEETKKCKKLLVWPHVLKWFHANSTRLVIPDDKPAEDVQIKVLELLGLEWLEEAPEGVKRAMDDKLLNNGKSANASNGRKVMMVSLRREDR